MARIHIVGASGSGTTTLGGALAKALNIRHFDSDAYFWTPTEPPFTTPRPSDERDRMVRADLDHAGDWVLSGSALKWNAGLDALYDLVVFLRIDPQLRMDRILAREAARYGARIAPGGDMHEKSQEFIAWARSYDSAGPERRSLVAHEAWLATLAAPVIRLDSNAPVDELVARVISHATLTPLSR